VKLAEDIAERDLIEPPKLLDGQVIDGRHRILAMVMLGWSDEKIRKHCTELAEDTDDALAYLKSRNWVRDHLTVAQKATIIAGLIVVKHGGNRQVVSSPLATQSQAARDFHVPVTAIQQARRILHHGITDVQALVWAEPSLSLSYLDWLAQRPTEEQEETVRRNHHDVALRRMRSEAKKPKRDLGEDWARARRISEARWHVILDQDDAFFHRLERIIDEQRRRRPGTTTDQVVR
jgi:hypothetical protein